MFSSEADDRLMNSLIGVYAIEGNENGVPDGRFFLTKKNARAVAGEVVESHFGFKGDEKENFLNERFERAYRHADPLNEGYFPVAKGPVLLRNLIDSVELSNKLQLQLEESGAITQESEYRPNPVQSPWAAKPEEAAPTTLTGAYTPG